MLGSPATSKLASPSTLDIPQTTSRQERVYSTGSVSEDSNEDDVRDRRQEAGTITDLHNTSNVAEVEIISLLEEKIPLYKLRADTATGYAYDDWLGSSLGTVLEEGDGENEEEDGRYDLSPEMMEETLKYFTLCGDRVVQMTKTYNDIDAVTRLLEEKEKDLELAAKIGQSLLQQNKQLDARIETLEEQVTVLSDQNTQLRHDIKLKNELLAIYTNDVGYSDSEDENSWSDKSSGKPTVQSRFIDVETLQKKVRTFEEENLHLRMETADLRTTTTSIEEKEQQLMHDCVKQLGEAQSRESILAEELGKKYEENARQQEEITNLLAQIVDLQSKVKKLTIENEEMQHHLSAARESQQDLTDEVQDLRDKYDECHEMLLESQEAVKEVHRRSLPQGKVPSYSALNPLPVFPLCLASSRNTSSSSRNTAKYKKDVLKDSRPQSEESVSDTETSLKNDSLAAELVNTVEQELGVEPHLTGKGRRDHQRSVMRTVKAANRRGCSSRQSSVSDLSVSDLHSIRTSPNSSLISLAGSPRSEQYEGDNESICSPIGSKSKSIGKVGIPGSNDLETALRRLSLRRQNKEAERKYKEEEKERLLTESDIEESGEQTPTCTTPGSMWSSGDAFGYSGAAAHNFKAFMPEKLQIVKPMEGSMTLYHWQRLATPHMASMLDSRPGVAVKGFREIDTDEDDEMYSLDEIEDDGILRSTIPSKCFVNTSSTYTYTTSNIGLLDNTNLSSSTMGPRMTSTPLISTGATTRARSTSTFSTSMGLAQVLQERETPKKPSVRTKAEASTAPSPRKANMGLNFFSAGRVAAEKKAEMSTMPGGVHQVRRGIISRNATPVLSKTAAKVLDPETKERLLEKVKLIRAKKQHETFMRRLSMSEEGIHTTRTASVTMSSSVSKQPAFKTGVAPRFCDAPTGLTLSTGLTMSTATLPSSSILPSSSLNPSSGAIPKGSFPYHYPSTIGSSHTSSAMSSLSSSLLLSSSSMQTRTSVLPPPSAQLTPPNALTLGSHTGAGLSTVGSLGAPTGLGLATVGSLDPNKSSGPAGLGLAAVGPLDYNKSSGPAGLGLATVSSLDYKTSSSPAGLGLASVSSLDSNKSSGPAGLGLATVSSVDYKTTSSPAGLGFASVSSLDSNKSSGPAGLGLAGFGSLDSNKSSSPTGVGLASVGSIDLNKKGSSTTGLASATGLVSATGLASVSAFDQTTGVTGKAGMAGKSIGLAAVGALHPTGSITRIAAGAVSPPGAGGGLGLGALSPHGTASALSVLSGGKVDNLKNKQPSGQKL